MRQATLEYGQRELLFGKLLYASVVSCPLEYASGYDVVHASVVCCPPICPNGSSRCTSHDVPKVPYRHRHMDTGDDVPKVPKSPEVPEFYVCRAGHLCAYSA